MALRALLVAASTSAAAAATCHTAEACAAAAAGGTWDEPSLIQTVRGAGGRSTKGFPGLKEKLSAAKDDEDPQAALVGLAEAFEQHPDHPGLMEVLGKVWVTASEGLSDSTHSQRVYWQLLDVDQACDKGPGSKSNSCSIKVEEGNQCKGESSKSAFDSASRNVDPWAFVTYTSVKKELPEAQMDKPPALAQTSSGYTPVRSKLTMRAETGLSAKEVEGQTVVVYDFEGKAMACAQIARALSRPEAEPMIPMLLQQATPKPLRAAHFVKYPNSGTDLDVWGEVLLWELLGESIPTMGHYMTWDLEGTDPKCQKGRSENPKSCSVRITKSSSCSDPNEEAFYKTEERHSNPWDYVSYTSVQGLHIVVARSPGVPVLTGHDSPDAMDQTVIVYDYEGKPAACAVVDMQ